MFTQHSHCSYCGHPFEIDQAWPRLCAACGNTSFVNPLPVAVVILPVNEGVLAVPEKKALNFLAARMPWWVTSDQLTLLGLSAMLAQAERLAAAMMKRESKP